jgi:predicted dehydrogenase
VRVGVVGYGYWGPNLVRNFSEILGPQSVAVCDMRPDLVARAQSRYPTVQATTDFQDLLNDSTIDAVAIATPVSTHFNLAMAALQAGKHVLVEKPITDTAEKAFRLIEEADRRGLVLMVDHTFLYTSAVSRMKELITSGKLGQIYYYDSVRVNLGLFQHDINVLWDLAVHDLSIMDYLLEERPTAVSVTAIAHVPGQMEDMAYLTVFFSSTLIAHFHVSWLAPVKVRRTLIGGERQMFVYDELEADEKLKIYDKGVSIRTDGDNRYSLLVDYRSGDMWAPKLDRTEALYTEALHFLECVESGRTPLSDGPAGLRLVQILEAADASHRRGGAPVELSSVLTPGGVR